jgi:hypothetical protein
VTMIRLFRVRASHYIDIHSLVIDGTLDMWRFVMSRLNSRYRDGQKNVSPAQNGLDDRGHSCKLVIKPYYVLRQFVNCLVCSLVPLKYGTFSYLTENTKSTNLMLTNHRAARFLMSNRACIDRPDLCPIFFLFAKYMSNLLYSVVYIVETNIHNCSAPHDVHIKCIDRCKLLFHFSFVF